MRRLLFAVLVAVIGTIGRPCAVSADSLPASVVQAQFHTGLPHVGDYVSIISSAWTRGEAMSVAVNGHPYEVLTGRQWADVTFACHASQPDLPPCHSTDADWITKVPWEWRGKTITFTITGLSSGKTATVTQQFSIAHTHYKHPHP